MEESYKDRLKTEFHELHERLDKLSNFINEIHAGNVPEDFNSNITLLEAQFGVMLTYQSILILRAQVEEVEL